MKRLNRGLTQLEDSDNLLDRIDLPSLALKVKVARGVSAQSANAPNPRISKKESVRSLRA